MIEVAKPDAMDTVGQVLSWLETDKDPSRNREFNRFNSNDQGHALSLYRSYSSLLKEIESLAGLPEFSLNARKDEDGLWVEVYNSRLSYRRICRVPMGLCAHLKSWLAQSGLSLPGEEDCTA
jgi:hypothetical protein